MIYYNGAHSMTFIKKPQYGHYSSATINDMLLMTEGEEKDSYVKNTWKDWKLIPLDGFVIGQPIKKRSIIELPGNDGSVDLSGGINGSPIYSNRTGSFEFYFVSKSVQEGFELEWPEICSEILTFFNQNEIMLILEDDKFFYYKGNCWLNSFKSDRNLSKIVIDYDVEPYKYGIPSPCDVRDHWLWDPLDFNKGYIQDGYCSSTSTKYISISPGTKIVLICGQKPQKIRIHLLLWHVEKENSVKIHCTNKSLVYPYGTTTEEFESVGSGPISDSYGENYYWAFSDVFLSDSSKNVNVEKTLLFDFYEQANWSNIIEIVPEYHGGFL